MRNLALCLCFAVASVTNTYAQGDASLEDHAKRLEAQKNLLLQEIAYEKARQDLLKLQNAVGEAPTKGKVEFAGNSEVMEGTLLSAHAIARAGKAIADLIQASPAGQSLVIATSVPDFTSWRSFKDSHTLLTQQHERRLGGMSAKYRCEVTYKLTGMGAPEAAIALAAASQLLSWFKSDYSVRGARAIEATDGTDLLAAAVAGELAAHRTVYLADFYAGAASKESPEVLSQLQEAIAEEQQYRLNVSVCEEEMKKEGLSKDAKAGFDTTKKLWEASAAAHGKWLAWVLDSAKGPSLYERAAAFEHIHGAMQTSSVVYLKVVSAVASAHTKSNMWTGLGAMPFYAAGGAIARFAVVDGKSGSVQAAGAQIIHGGFKSAGEVERQLGE